MEYDLRRSLFQLKLFVFHPARAFRRMTAEPDVLGALFVIDAFAFFSVVVAVVAGVVEPSLSVGFLVRFLILYAMMLVLFGLLVGFEALVALIGVKLAGGRQQTYASMYCVFGYAKLPLVAAALIYVFLPVRLDLSTVLEFNGESVVSIAYASRLELFEAMSLVLGAVGTKIVSRVGFLQITGIVLIGWILGTPVFYTVFFYVLRG